MKTSTILIILFIIIIVIFAIIVFSTTCDRNYWKRSLPIQKCPFGKVKYQVIEILGSENIPNNYLESQIEPYSKNTAGIISYSLFGNYKKYSPTLIESIKVIPTLLSGWYARVYAGNDIPQTIKQELISNGAVVYIMNKNIGFEAALWRFLPAGELIPFVSLDADDLFDQKIASQIKNWISSNYAFANFSKHGFVVPMAAGLWGARPLKNTNIQGTQKSIVNKIILDGNNKKTIYSPPIPNIADDLNNYCEHWFGFDEAYLKTNVWPLFKTYGYYQTNSYHLKELSILGLILVIIVMVYTIYSIRKLER